MKYEKVEDDFYNKLFDILNNEKSEISEITNAVLASIYYGDDHRLSGDILINEFIKCPDQDKYYMKNIFYTYYKIFKNNYKIDLVVEQLNNYKMSKSGLETEIDDLISDIVELGKQHSQ